MKKHLGISVILISIFISCDTSEVNEVRGDKVEIYYPPNLLVEHGDWLIIDGRKFVHDRYAQTIAMDGHIPDSLANSVEGIRLPTSRSVAFIGTDKEIEDRISGNAIAHSLALSLTQLSLDGETRFYNIQKGPRLLFEGRVGISRHDGKEVVIEFPPSYKGLIQVNP